MPVNGSDMKASDNSPMFASEPMVMGILNVTPDSFSDGGQHNTTAAAVERALAMQAEGASIIDIGGESTRPGAESISLQEELDRVIPVIAALSNTGSQLRVPISIDTTKVEVMRQAVAAGATIINDVNALQADGALAVAADLAVPVCVMHRQGDAKTMQDAPFYQDVGHEVLDYLLNRAQACRAAGIEKIIVDPGFGFGKTFQHNVELFKFLPEIKTACDQLGYQLLVGVSRKRMVGEALQRVAAPANERAVGSAVLAGLAAQAGANILRVHDVRATVDAISMMQHFA